MHKLVAPLACLSVCLLSACLPVCLYALCCLLSACRLFACLSACLPVCLSVCLSVSLSVSVRACVRAITWQPATTPHAACVGGLLPRSNVGFNKRAHYLLNQPGAEHIEIVSTVESAWVRRETDPSSRHHILTNRSGVVKRQIVHFINTKHTVERRPSLLSYEKITVVGS